MRTLIVTIAAAVFAVALVDRFRSLGGPYFQIPATIQDHVVLDPFPSRDAIILCRQAAEILPRGATVTVLMPSQAPNYDATLAQTALGLMPHQRVLPPNLDVAERPQFVLSVREPLAHPAYRPYSTLRQGWIYALQQ